MQFLFTWFVVCSSQTFHFFVFASMISGHHSGVVQVASNSRGVVHSVTLQIDREPVIVHLHLCVHFRQIVVSFRATIVDVGNSLKIIDMHRRWFAYCAKWCTCTRHRLPHSASHYKVWLQCGCCSGAFCHAVALPLYLVLTWNESTKYAVRRRIQIFHDRITGSCSATENTWGVVVQYTVETSTCKEYRKNGKERNRCLAPGSSTL